MDSEVGVNLCAGNISLLSAVVWIARQGPPELIPALSAFTIASASRLQVTDNYVSSLHKAAKHLKHNVLEDDDDNSDATPAPRGPSANLLPSDSRASNEEIIPQPKNDMREASRGIIQANSDSVQGAVEGATNLQTRPATKQQSESGRLDAEEDRRELEIQANRKQLPLNRLKAGTYYVHHYTTPGNEPQLTNELT